MKTSWRNDKRAAANLHLRCNASAAQTQRPCKALHYKCTYSSLSIHFVTLLSMQLSFYSHWRFNARCADDLVCAHEFFFIDAPDPHGRSLLYCFKVHQRRKKSGSNLWWPSIGGSQGMTQFLTHIDPKTHFFVLEGYAVYQVPWSQFFYTSHCLKIIQKSLIFKYQTIKRFTVLEE